MMERWEKSQERRREVVLLHNHNHNHNQNPSFSSTLLDSIYRSIDEPNGNINNLKEAEEEELIFYKETSMMMMKKKKKQQQQQQQVSSCNTTSTHEARWTTEHVQDWRVPISSELQNPKMNIKPIKTKINNIIPLSSSSSTQEKVANNKPKSSTSSSTSINNINININGSFVKTRSKAMKLYSDLKKVKQPISPGGKLATFLNSIFTAGNAKKPKISPSLSSSSNSSSSYSYSNSNSNFSSSKFDQQTPSCSSTSSFSRSCLSKTPSSSRANVKRSVRFYPVSVIVDEDSKPCGHKNLHETNSSSTSTKLVSELIEVRVMEENRRVVEAAKELLKNYHKKKEEYEHVINNIGGGGDMEIDLDLDLDLDLEDDDDDDLASCASSDLFELDNLSVVGVDNINHQIRYREELPVYETTYVRANRAIANAFIL